MTKRRHQQEVWREGKLVPQTVLQVSTSRNGHKVVLTFPIFPDDIVKEEGLLNKQEKKDLSAEPTDETKSSSAELAVVPQFRLSKLNIPSMVPPSRQAEQIASKSSDPSTPTTPGVLASPYKAVRRVISSNSIIGKMKEAVATTKSTSVSVSNPPPTTTTTTAITTSDSDPNTTIISSTTTSTSTSQELHQNVTKSMAVMSRVRRSSSTVQSSVSSPPSSSTKALTPRAGIADVTSSQPKITYPPSPRKELPPTIPSSSSDSPSIKPLTSKSSEQSLSSVITSPIISAQPSTSSNNSVNTQPLQSKSGDSSPESKRKERSVVRMATMGLQPISLMETPSVLPEIVSSPVSSTGIAKKTVKEILASNPLPKSPTSSDTPVEKKVATPTRINSSALTHKTEPARPGVQTVSSNEKVVEVSEFRTVHTLNVYEASVKQAVVAPTQSAPEPPKDGDKVIEVAEFRTVHTLDVFEPAKKPVEHPAVNTTPVQPPKGGSKEIEVAEFRTVHTLDVFEPAVKPVSSPPVNSAPIQPKGEGKEIEVAEFRTVHTLDVFEPANKPVNEPVNPMRPPQQPDISSPQKEDNKIVKAVDFNMAKDMEVFEPKKPSTTPLKSTPPTPSALSPPPVTSAISSATNTPINTVNSPVPMKSPAVPLLPLANMFGTLTDELDDAVKRGAQRAENSAPDRTLSSRSNSEDANRTLDDDEISEMEEPRTMGAYVFPSSHVHDHSHGAAEGHSDSHAHSHNHSVVNKTTVVARHNSHSEVHSNLNVTHDHGKAPSSGPTTPVAVPVPSVNVTNSTTIIHTTSINNHTTLMTAAPAPPLSQSNSRANSVNGNKVIVPVRVETASPALTPVSPPRIISHSESTSIEESVVEVTLANMNQTIQPFNPNHAPAPPPPYLRNMQSYGFQKYVPYALSDDEVMQLIMLISAQEASYNKNMFDGLNRHDKDEVDRLVQTYGLAYEDASLIVFEKKFAGEVTTPFPLFPNHVKKNARKPLSRPASRETMEVPLPPPVPSSGGSVMSMPTVSLVRASSSSSVMLPPPPQQLQHFSSSGSVCMSVASMPVSVMTPQVSYMSCAQPLQIQTQPSMYCVQPKPLTPVGRLVSSNSSVVSVPQQVSPTQQQQITTLTPVGRLVTPVASCNASVVSVPQQPQSPPQQVMVQQQSVNCLVAYPVTQVTPVTAIPVQTAQVTTQKVLHVVNPVHHVVAAPSPRTVATASPASVVHCIQQQPVQQMYYTTCVPVQQQRCGQVKQLVSVYENLSRHPSSGSITVQSQPHGLPRTYSDIPLPTQERPVMPQKASSEQLNGNRRFFSAYV